jgi:hypothetical protein
MFQWLCGYCHTVMFHSIVIVINTTCFGFKWPSSGIFYVVSFFTVSSPCDVQSAENKLVINRRNGMFKHNNIIFTILIYLVEFDVLTAVIMNSSISRDTNDAV